MARLHVIEEEDNVKKEQKGEGSRRGNKNKKLQKDKEEKVENKKNTEQTNIEAAKEKWG